MLHGARRQTKDLYLYKWYSQRPGQTELRLTGVSMVQLIEEHLTGRSVKSGRFYLPDVWN